MSDPFAIRLPTVMLANKSDQIAAMDDVAVWIQPGAADDDVRAKVKELDLPALVDACIMIQARSRA